MASFCMSALVSNRSQVVCKGSSTPDAVRCGMLRCLCCIPQDAATHQVWMNPNAVAITIS